MKTILFIILLTLSSHGFAQINIQLLHQLVEDSKTEYAKQSEAKNKQVINTTNEEINKNLLGQVKDGYKTIQERFAKLTIVFDAAGIAMTATPLVRSIIDNQQQIVFYCQQDPTLLPFAFETEKLFAAQSYSLMNYLVGLSASISDLNQMKISERRILFQHIIAELRNINQLSLGTSRTLESHLRRKMGGNPYLDYVQQEMKLVDEIMTNIKILKH